MPVPLGASVAEAGEAAVGKAGQARLPGRYLVSSALAGVYVGVAVVLLLSVAGPLAAGGSPLAKLVAGGVFGIALALVVFAGAELFTGNVMTMLFGTLDRRVSWRALGTVWGLSLLGNLAGSIAFGLLVHAGGTLAAGGQAGGRGPGAKFLAAVVAAKETASGSQLFARAVLCNMLVCLALWMAARTTSDGAKLVVLAWPLLAFIGSGFEHCVANMTIYTLAIAQGDATVGEAVRNLAWTVPGNVVGGGLLVAAAYWFVARPAGAPQTDAAGVEAAPEPAEEPAVA